MNAVQHRYVASRRNGYSAIDDYVGDNPMRTIIAGQSKMTAHIVAGALNQAFEEGRQFGHEEAKDAEMCEGYKNYPTSSVALWIQNDQSIQDYYTGMAKALIMTQQSISDFANILKESVESNLTGDGTESPYSELVGYALSSTDWYELAEEIWNDAKESN